MINKYHTFQSQHLDAVREDFFGNGELGQYMILTGSDQRAKDIDSRFCNLKVKSHSKHHNLYPIKEA